jgi:hypothetical protein
MDERMVDWVAKAIYEKPIFRNGRWGPCTLKWDKIEDDPGGDAVKAACRDTARAAIKAIFSYPAH